MSFMEKLFGNFSDKELKRIKPIANKVLELEPEMQKLTDEELQAKTPYFKQLLASGKTLDEIQPEAFAVCREAAKRVIGQYPYNEQVFGAQVLHEGDVAEMKTGEGKTLTATMAVYTNALSGKGVHVVTVNEYLASRDADWMGRIYRFLGLTVGVNLREKSTQEKQEAYKCDVTYTTNSEVGFDYLRDNMATDPKQRVLRELNFAVIDEADSILIDESRTPLIISGGSGVTASSYEIADRVVKSLKKNTDFEIDIKKKSCSLTDSGVDKVQKAFGVTNLYEPQHSDMVHRIHQALKANFTMSRNVEYMVKNDEIVLIDTNTGRTMEGREYSDGLQQAIQAKEHVKIKPETITLATITYQNFFRLYNKLSGMTGTAKTEEEEFRKIERELYKRFSTPKKKIIATGGGVIKNPANIANLKKGGVIVYLKSSPEKIAQNLKFDNTRPILQVDDKEAKIRELLAQREPFYNKYAEITIDVSNYDIDHTVDKIIELAKV